MCKLILIGIYMINLCQISYIMPSRDFDDLPVCEITLRDGNIITIEASECSDVFRKIEQSQ